MMTPQLLEQVLKDLPRYGTLVKDYPYRKVWRVDVDGEQLYIKFYPQRENRWRIVGRGSPAMREFTRLQWLQKAKVTAARAHSVLMGLTIGGHRGDAVVIEAIRPAVSLLDLAQQSHLAGQPLPNQRQIVNQLIHILQQLGAAGLGHGDLHLGNFLLKDDKLFLIDAYPVHKRGMLLRDVMALADSARGLASRTDLQRAWNALGPGGPLPAKNLAAGRVYRKLMSRIYGDNRYFAKVIAADWKGVCFQRFSRPRRWSQLSQMEFDAGHWKTAWDDLLAKINRDELTVLKRSRSGDVLEGQITVGDRTLDVIIKRPRRRYWYRYLNEVGRGSRAYRAWWKSWRLIHRHIPCAWPLLLMEKRTLGYATDSIIVFEKVKGPSLATIDLDAMDSSNRQTLFHRTGALLRQLEAAGLYHWDAKSSNFMVLLDDPTGPTPLLVDVDGVRNNWGIGEGMRRLLLAMRQHPQYTPQDSLALCRGYAPFAPIAMPEA